MKKIISLLVCLILICSFSVTAFAAGAAATLNGVPSELKNGATATITVNASGTPAATSALIQVTLGDGLELVSGEWKKDGVMKDFTVSNGYGVLALSSAGTFDGTVFSFVVKGKTSSAAAQNITVALTFKNGSSTVGTASVSKSVKVVCATHTYNAWTNDSASQHKHTCTVCGYEEKVNHTWNGGTVTKQETCKEAGNKKYTCTACGAEKNETIAKTTNHTYGSWTTTKEATCTDAGTKTRTCSVCGETESQSVPATGHSYGAWSTTKEPTCTEKGIQTRKCSKCGATETKDSAALGHSFSHPTVTKQPTCTETGIESGKCTRCDKETTNIIKATGHSFGEWSDTKAATCTEKGMQEHTCSKCSSVETRETDALGHDFDKPVVIKEATLTEKGIEEGICKTCGEKTQAEIPCSFKDAATGIVIKTEEGVFQQGTEMHIEVIEKEHADFELVRTALKEVGSDFVAFDVSAIRDNAVVQPNGTVTVSFKIPEGFGKNVAVFYISDEGVGEKLESAVSEDGTSVSATLSHFSSYAVVKLETVETETNVDDALSEAPNSTLWIIIAVAAVVLIGGAVSAVIIIKKKKANIGQ